MGAGQSARGSGVGYFVNERLRRRGGARRGESALAVSPAQQALRELIRAGGLLRGLSESHFAQYSLTMAQWGVLRSLQRLELQGNDQPRMYELGAVLVVRPPSLSATLDRMERVGLVSRRVDTRDNRSRIISLAPGGRRLLDRVTADHQKWIPSVMSALKPREQVVLGRLLTTLGLHMQDLSRRPGVERAARRTLGR